MIDNDVITTYCWYAKGTNFEKSFKKSNLNLILGLIFHLRGTVILIVYRPNGVTEVVSKTTDYSSFKNANILLFFVHTLTLTRDIASGS